MGYRPSRTTSAMQDEAPILCTEQWRDLEHIVGNIPNRFMGRQEAREAEDTELGLRILGAETFPRNVASVQGFGAGDFWHQDAYGRVADALRVGALGLYKGPRAPLGGRRRERKSARMGRPRRWYGDIDELVEKEAGRDRARRGA